MVLIEIRNTNCQKINWIGTMFGFKEDEIEKMEREV